MSEQCGLLQRLPKDGASLARWPSKKGEWHLRFFVWNGWEWRHGDSPEALLLTLPEPIKEPTP